MNKRFLFFLICMLLQRMITLAYDFEVDGMFYDIVGNNKVSLTYKNQNYNTYSGSVTIPEKVNKNNRSYIVTRIGASAFRDCKELVNIDIPNSITSIDNLAFHNCSKLTQVDIPSSVTFIGGGAFLGCSLLASINVMNTVESIGGFAFDGTAWYNNQPNGVVYVGLVAYKYKGNMPSGTCIIIKEGTIAIASSAFESCNKLNAISIPNTVKSIGNGAFYSCSGLTEIDFPNSITYIGDNAFQFCDSLSYISIPESTEIIGTGAFQNCSNLDSINIPVTVTSIGRFAFDGTAWYDNQLKGLVYAGSVVYKYKGYLPNGSNIELAEGTVGIAGAAFSNCSGLSYINLPNSLVTIGDYAFYGCNKLSSIVLPNSVISIGDYAFYQCGITSITLSNSISSIKKNTFGQCGNLSQIHISDLEAWCNIEFEDYDSNPLCYANHLFMNGEEIKDLVIPNTVTSISRWAFSNCSGITSVYFPNTITSIGDYAFYWCGALTSINFSSSITDIGDYAFSNCNNLSSIAFPNSISYIGEGAFSGCYNLKTMFLVGDGEWNAGDLRVDYPDDYQSISSLNIGSGITSITGINVNPSDVFCYAPEPPLCDDKSFSGFSGTLHVPAVSLAKYFSSPYWKNFTNLVGDVIEPMDISIDYDSIKLCTGEHYKLTASIYPEEASQNSVFWKSTNPNVASVHDGIVSANAAGECDIIVTCIDKFAVCHIVVKNSITLDKHEAWLFPNQILTLTPNAPSSVISNLRAKSSDQTVAIARIVEEMVQVLAIKEGSSIITVFSDDILAEPDSCRIVVYSRSCDINGDGEVNIADINVIIDCILNDDNSVSSCDANGDGEINIADINYIINVILTWGEYDCKAAGL